jgi:hypothetical protein
MIRRPAVNVKIKFHFLVVVFMNIFPNLSYANNFCSIIIQSSNNGGLRSMADHLIENGTCMAAREAVAAIVRSDAVSEKLCIEATAHMKGEFQRRFPNRNTSSVTGRC